jgi:hypothetical protein
MDWSSIDALTLKPLYSCCEAIRLAIREGQLAAGMSLTLGYDLHPRSIASVFQDIQTAISGLIPYFVDHTDGAGDWDGVPQYDYAPSWTEAGLLAAIEAPSRLSMAIMGSPEEWIYQQYQILNMLRWVKKSLSISNSQFKIGRSDYLYDTRDAAYEAALVEFESASWEAGEPSGPWNHPLAVSFALTVSGNMLGTAPFSGQACIQKATVVNAVSSGTTQDLYVLIQDPTSNPDLSQMKRLLSESGSINYTGSLPLFSSPSDTEDYKYLAYQLPSVIIKTQFNFRNW